MKGVTASLPRGQCAGRVASAQGTDAALSVPWMRTDLQMVRADKTLQGHLLFGSIFGNMYIFQREWKPP